MEKKTLFKELIKCSAEQKVDSQQISVDAKYRVNSIYVGRLSGKSKQSNGYNEILLIGSKNGNYIDINTGVEYGYKKSIRILRGQVFVSKKSPLCYVCYEALQQKQICSNDMLTAKQLNEVFDEQQKLWTGNKLSTLCD